MTLDDLSVNFEHLDATHLLDDWRWLVDAQMHPVLITLAGDAFLQDRRDGRIHFLDTVEGTLEGVADDADAFRALLADREFVGERFCVNLVAPIIKAGQRPGPGQLLGLKTPPVLGGDYDADNLAPTDVAVHFSVSGQIFEQMKDLPDGAEIDQIRIR